MAHAVIYALQCPDRLQVVYVGQTKNPHRRRLMHNRLSNNKGDRPLCRWLRQLITAGKTPNFLILEEPADLNATEVRWIAELRSEGFDLLNMNDGGNYPSQFAAMPPLHVLVGKQTALHRRMADIALARKWIRKNGTPDQIRDWDDRADKAIAAVRRAKQREGALMATLRISHEMEQRQQERSARIGVAQ